jgi:hypothetical protein
LLVIGGFAKCGTSSLFAWLSQHPEVCPAAIKETPLRRFESWALRNWCEPRRPCWQIFAIGSVSHFQAIYETESEALHRLTGKAGLLDPLHPDLG